MENGVIQKVAPERDLKDGLGWVREDFKIPGTEARGWGLDTRYCIGVRVPARWCQGQAGSGRQWPCWSPPVLPFLPAALAKPSHRGACAASVRWVSGWCREGGMNDCGGDRGP